MMRHDSVSPVGIVGAGPVGMVTAARLASFGIPSVIFEADPHLRKQGSKACLIQGDVLEVLDKFGCADQINDEGVTWNVARTYVRNKEIRRAEYPLRLGYGPFVNISQYRIEQVLLAKVNAEPLCEIRWGHTVTDVRQDGDSVTITADTPDGSREFTFAYLVACDGVRSELRRLTGVAWTGYSHEARFLITDIKANLPLEKERHFHYDPSFNPGRQVVIHPQPDNIWRIDWQLPPSTDIDAERESGEFDQRVRAVIGDIDYEIDWVSTYRFHQRVVENFKFGRVFFAGDAAHSLPPYGSRGMNSGIQDADNLAWKLAYVLDGRVSESLLETYHDERYDAAVENLQVTEATIKFMVPPSLPRRLLRSTLLGLARVFKGTNSLVNSGRMAEPYTYTDSPIVDPAGSHPLAGGFAPDVLITADGRLTRLRRLFGTGFTALYIGSNPGSAQRFAQAALAQAGTTPLNVVVALPSSVRVPDLPDGVTVIHDVDGWLTSLYDAERPRWLLVRPDGHIAATGTQARIGDAIARSSGAAESMPVEDRTPLMPAGASNL